MNLSRNFNYSDDDVAELLKLNDRLYCAVQALAYGDEMQCGHEARVVGELLDITERLNETLLPSATCEYKAAPSIGERYDARGDCGACGY